MRRVTWLCTLLMLLPSPGCISSSPGEDLTTIGTDPTLAIDTASTSQAFDFGPILAHGQTLRHEFTLTNPSKRPLRLLRATSYTPCCSAVESLPESIPPGGEGKVAVRFRPGHQSGHKAIRFAVETDSSEQVVRTLILRARLFAEWEIFPAGDPIASLPIGTTGKQAYRIVCRRKGLEGLGSPESVKVVEPLQSRFVGPANEQQQPDGVVESTRDVEVILPAVPKLGSQLAELAFLWPNGHKRTHLIRWEITPRVRMIPSSIILEPCDEPIEQSITITSDDRPFRITKVVGALLAKPAGYSPLAERTHRLVLSLDPDRAVRGRISNILIGTDCPEQPELNLRALALPSKPADGGHENASPEQ